MGQFKIKRNWKQSRCIIGCLVPNPLCSKAIRHAVWAPHSVLHIYRHNKSPSKHQTLVCTTEILHCLFSSLHSYFFFIQRFTPRCKEARWLSANSSDWMVESVSHAGTLHGWYRLGEYLSGRWTVEHSDNRLASLLRGWGEMSPLFMDTMYQPNSPGSPSAEESHSNTAGSVSSPSPYQSTNRSIKHDKTDCTRIILTPLMDVSVWLPGGKLNAKINCSLILVAEISQIQCKY